MHLSTAIVALFVFGATALLFAPALIRAERGSGALGRLRPLTDAIRTFTRDDTRAEHRDLLHVAVPFLSVAPAVVGFAVIPFGGSYSAWGARWSLVVADPDYGVLYLFAVAAIATYGTLLAGQAGSNDWGVFGALRASSQMLSYQVASGLSLVGVFMVFGALRLTDIGLAQQQLFRVFGFAEHLGWVAPGTPWVDWIALPMWGVLLQPLAFPVFLATILAAGKRAPFDPPEAESEIAAGWFVEYGGARLGLYMLRDWAQLAVIAGLATALFLGGWSIPWLSDALLVGGLARLLGADLANVLAMAIHVAVFFAKLGALVWLQLLLRQGLQRLRYDQVMDLGWKLLVPLSLANVAVTGLVVLLVREVAG